MAIRHRVAERLAGRVYYGWIVVGVVYSVNLVAFAINPTFGLFVTPLEQEFGWSRATLARSIPVGTLIGAVLSPAAGALIDRVGLRVLMIGGGLVSGACFMALAGVRQAWQYNLLLGIAFGVMTTGVGQLLGSVAVARWFVRRRGRAMGIVMMGASSGGLLWVTLVTVLIATFGWRMAFIAQGTLTLVLIVVPVWLLMIDTPESLGLSDHAPGDPTAPKDAADPDAYPWTLRQALRTRAFWMTLLGVSVASFAVTGYFAHAVPILESHGLSRGVASGAWAAFFFTGILAKFTWGFAIERLSVRYSLMICLLAEAGGILLLLNAHSPTAAFVWAVLTGLGHGPFLQLLAMVWADYFGRRSLGAIFGTVQPIIVVAGSIGPWAAGALFDWRGDYLWFLVAAFVLALLAALVFALDTPPRLAAEQRGG